MSAFLSMYPNSVLDGLKKGQGLKQQLIDEITRVMTNDPDVRRLVQQRTSSGVPQDQLHTDAAFKQMVLDKTSAKVTDLTNQSAADE